MSMGWTCKVFCRYAAVVFLTVTVYTLISKGLGESLHDDWAHSLLHVGSAVAAGYAGWAARSARPAVLFTTVLAAIYVALGVVGWFIDGLLNTPVAVPLGPADNLFHLVVGGAAFITLLTRIRSNGPESQSD